MDLLASDPNIFIKGFDFLAKKLFGVNDYESDYDNLGCLDILNVTAEGDFHWNTPELMTFSYIVLTSNLMLSINSSISALSDSEIEDCVGMM